MKKLLLTFFLLLSFPVFADYSNIKQEDEFSCGVCTAANLINNQGVSLDFNELKRILKLSKKGITSNNLCKGLEKVLNTKIKYYGIKNVNKKYKVSDEIDLNKIDLGSGAILNFGVYDENLVRQWGHYVNLIKIENKTLWIIDPYDKNSYIQKIEVQKISNKQLKNKNDNEKYSKIFEYYLITTPLNYLEQNERAYINGIVITKPNNQHSYQGWD